MEKNYVLTEKKLEIFHEKGNLVYSATILNRRNDFVLTRNALGKIDLFFLDGQLAKSVFENAERGKFSEGLWVLRKYGRYYRISLDCDIVQWGKYSKGHYEQQLKNGKTRVRYMDDYGKLVTYNYHSYVFSSGKVLAFEDEKNLYHLFEVVRCKNSIALQPLRTAQEISFNEEFTFRFIPDRTGRNFRRECVEINREVEKFLIEINPNPCSVPVKICC